MVNRTRTRNRNINRDNNSADRKNTAPRFIYRERKPNKDPFTLQKLIHRWDSHVLVIHFKDTSALLSGNSDAFTPAFLLFWLVFILGIIIGGNSVFLLDWVIQKMYSYSSKLCHVVVALIIISGKELVPPATPLNGSDTLLQRNIFCILTYILHKLLPDVSLLKLICLISSLWHYDQGNAMFKDFQYQVRSFIQCHEGVNQLHEEDFVTVTRMQSLYFFQTSVGVGVFWAGFNIYSCKTFVIFSVVMVMCHCALYVLGMKYENDTDEGEDQNE